MKLKNKWASEISKFLSKTLIGKDFIVKTHSSIDNLSKNCLTFSLKKINNDFRPVLPALVICTPKMKKKLRSLGFTIIVHKEPKYAFCKVVDNFLTRKPKVEIHSTAIIDKKVRLGKNISVGPYTVIEGKVNLGDNIKIGSSVNIKNKVTIKNNTIIHSGSKIGYDPFSFGISKNLKSYLYPSKGAVLIGEFVEIFPNCTIARGTENKTKIGNWVKIGEQANIGNSVNIGDNSIICASTNISGRVKIGSKCWIAPKVSIRQGLKVGNNSTIGLGSVVVKNVPKNSLAMGVPAKIRK